LASFSFLVRGGGSCLGGLSRGWYQEREAVDHSHHSCRYQVISGFEPQSGILSPMEM
jgi:hypothetical protein